MLQHLNFLHFITGLEPLVIIFMTQSKQVCNPASHRHSPHPPIQPSTTHTHTHTHNPPAPTHKPPPHTPTPPGWARQTQNRRYLCGGLDALEHAQAHNGPGPQQTAGENWVELARLVDGVRGVQSLPEPEVCGGRAGSTLRHWRQMRNSRFTQAEVLSQLCQDDSSAATLRRETQNLKQAKASY